MNYEARVSNLRKMLEKEGLGAMFVTNLTNIRYLTGFTGSNAQLIVSPDASIFLTDGRYTTQAAEEVTASDIRVYQPSTEMGSMLGAAGSELGIGEMGFESDHVTVAALERFRGFFSGINLVGLSAKIEELRRVKDAQEIELIRKAADLVDAGFSAILERVEVGRTEKEIALELEMIMRQGEAEGVSFEIIVAAGARSALPHARPTDHTVEKGSYLLFDLGCVFGGYFSDMTRTVMIGQPEDRHRSVYEVVLASQEAGLAAVKTGATGAEVDAAARKVIDNAGYPDAFSHGLGHGVGLEIHEAPTLNSSSTQVLQTNEVVTVEPGAYFAGWGGVRIEDLVVVGEAGPQILSRTTKELIVL